MNIITGKMFLSNNVKNTEAKKSAWTVSLCENIYVLTNVKEPWEQCIKSLICLKASVVAQW